METISETPLHGVERRLFSDKSENFIWGVGKILRKKCPSTHSMFRIPWCSAAVMIRDFRHPDEHGTNRNENRPRRRHAHTHPVDSEKPRRNVREGYNFFFFFGFLIEILISR